MAARGETQANVEVSTLAVPAWRLRWRAPELALVLGERVLALTSARQDDAERLRAEALVVFAGNRVGRGVRVADRALDALKAAEAAGDQETAWLLRVELAACARAVGAPLTGFAAVMPVLEAADVPAELRASALVQASECLVTVGRGDEPTRALAEADQLYVADTELDEDMRLVLRGLIRAVQAAQHRRWGDIAAAIGAAREGLDLLSRLADQSADSGQAHGRLTLELALALMDANRMLDATEVGAPLLDRPVRAPGASTAGWLRLALATRVHLPAGRVAVARDMLRDAATSAERHQLDTVLAESLLALAHVHEVAGDLADALTNLRSAHAAERRRARAVYAVRARFAAEFSGVHRQPADLHRQLADLLRPIEGMTRPADGLLPAALKQQLRQWRPVQVRKADGLKVKRARRAAEDMTVEGLSAARAHAADRWRLVQPFGEPGDKTPDPVEPPPVSERTVPASGLIASAGAMVSGRRRAARVAAGEIEDTPAAATEVIPVIPASPEDAPSANPAPAEPQLSADQERKRKVEQQLMELQREARRQIEAERAARAEERAKVEREARQAAEEAARQEAARQEAARREAQRREAARQEAARQQAAREEAARQEAARQEAARQEAARQEAARQEAARQEAARQEAARQEAARQEAARQEAALQEAAREVAAREAARVEAARAQAARVEAARQEAARLEAARQEAARQEAVREEAARQEALRASAEREEAARQEAARHEAARQEAARQEAVRHESARHEAARQEIPRQEAARREAALHQGSHQESASQEAALKGAARAAADSDTAGGDTAGGDTAYPDTASPDGTASGVGVADPDRQATLRTRSPFAQPPFVPSSQEESVLDKLKAQGLRAGGRRRAPDATRSAPVESEADAPSWRVDPPNRLRDERVPGYSADAADPGTSQSFFADLSTSPPAQAASDEPSGPPETTGPNLFGDPDQPDRTARPGLAAAFSRPPAAPDFGPHVDDPAYPLFTPASGFPAAEPTPPPAPEPAEPDLDPQDLDLPDLSLPDLKLPELTLPELDFSSLDLGDLAARSQSAKPDWSTSSIPHPEPAEPPDPSQPRPTPEHEPEPVPPVPDPVPSVPVPDEVPRPSEPDLLTNTFLSAADVDDDLADLPTAPVQLHPDAHTARTPRSAGFSSAVAAPSEQGLGETAGPGVEADPAAATEAVGSPAPVEDTPAKPSNGRPSSRRKPSDLSLADLLAEALVAYETGRREDEEQFQAADLATEDWSTVDGDQPTPAVPLGQDEPQPGLPSTQDQTPPAFPLIPDQPLSDGYPLIPDQPTGAPAPGESGLPFIPGQPLPPDLALPQLPVPEPSPVQEQPLPSGDGTPFGSGRPSFADQPFVPGHLLGSGQQFGAEPSFGSPAPQFGANAQFGLPALPSTEHPVPAADTSGNPPTTPPGGLSVEASREETTGPIVPVGTASEEETTGPIRRVQTDGVGGWTLPGT
ncbi:hypothetical protein ACVDFE_39320 [Lentzea chajnantorensis]